MNASNPSDSEKELEAPASLVRALNESSRRDIFVPGYVESEILRAARQHLARPAKNSFVKPRRWMLWPALGVVCVLIACLLRLFNSSQVAYRSNEPLYAREDINHDGKVDILDAFALARALKSEKPLPPDYDIHGDGVVDKRDVALIAAHAVQLKKDNGS